MNPLVLTMHYAAAKHANQKYGVLPYTHHLQDVEEVLHRFGVGDLDLLKAAWLHDVVEDTGTKIREIEEVFGQRVAELVWAVTNEAGLNRAARAVTVYPKILACKDAIVLKLADRIANVEAGGSMFKTYKKEYDSFKRNLFAAPNVTDDTAERMWQHLDELFEKDSLEAKYAEK